MFRNVKFTLVEYSIDFAKKRAEVIKNVIIKYKGEIIEMKNVCMNVLPNYVITSKNAKRMKDLFPKAEEELLVILQTKILNYEYVSACVKEKCLLDTYLYRIIMNDTFNKKKYKYIPNTFEDIIGNNNNDNSSDDDNDNNITSSYNPFTITSFSQNVNYTSSDIVNNILSPKSNEDIFKQIQYSIKTKYSLNKENISITNVNNNIPKSCPKTYVTQSQPYGNWAFINTGSSKKENLNEHITSQLEKIQTFHSNEGNIFESLAYRKAITQLKNHPTKITEINHISSLKHIGSKISSKIKEILLTGNCNKSLFLSNDTKSLSIQTLTKVHGIGIKQANEFYRKGITTISQLKQISHTLPLLIQKGLQYYDDIQIKIPRSEISEIYEIIKEELYKVLPKEVVNVEICGSYRRGKSECGDIDILITRKDNGKVDGILETMVEKLMERKVIVDVLSMSEGEGNFKNMFMGICIGKMGICRRLDMKVYEKEEFPFAVLYFTGSAYFNRSMRLYAKKKKMHLSDKELSYRNTGIKIKCETEEDIFKALGIEYKPPCEREI